MGSAFKHAHQKKRTNFLLYCSMKVKYTRFFNLSIVLLFFSNQSCHRTPDGVEKQEAFTMDEISRILPYDELHAANSWANCIKPGNGLTTPVARLIDNSWWYENFENLPVAVEDCMKQTLFENSEDASIIGVVPGKGVNGSAAFCAKVKYLPPSHPEFSMGGTDPGAALVYLEGISGGQLYTVGYKIRTEKTRRSKFGLHILYHPEKKDSDTSWLKMIQHQGKNLNNSWEIDSRYASSSQTWLPEWENEGGYTSQIIYPLVGGDSEGYEYQYMDVSNLFRKRMGPGYSEDFVTRSASTIYYTANHAEKYPEILFEDSTGANVLTGYNYSRLNVYSAKHFIHASGIQSWQNSGLDRGDQFANRVFPIPEGVGAITLFMKLYHSYGGTVYFDDIYLERLGTVNEYLTKLTRIYGSDLSGLPEVYLNCDYIQKFLNGELVSVQDYWKETNFPLPYHGRFESIFFNE